MEKKRNPNAWKTVLALGIVWTLAIALSTTWDYCQEKHSAEHTAITKARTVYNKDLLYRRWAANHGGVYVPNTDETPPNPYLSHMPDRDVVTTSGKELTLLNPAYMTRQVYELASQQQGALGHITSLNPIRPQNKPDQWETEALKEFEKGAKEVFSEELIDGRLYMRFMKPVVTEKTCLKCHASQGYKEGDVRGGISVSIPVTELLAASNKHFMRSAIGHVLVWIIGVVGIILAGRRQIKNNDKRRQAEKALLREKDRLAKAQEIGSIGTWELDLADNVLTWTEETHNIFGIPDGADLTYETFLECVHADDREYVNTEWMASVDGKPYDIEHRIIVNGKIKWVREKAELIRNDEGEAVGAIGVTQDITERKNAERDFEHFFEFVPDMICIASPEGHFIKVNPQWEKVLGYSIDEILHTPILDLIHPGDREATAKAIEIQVDGEAVTNFENRYRCKDGSYRWLNWFSAAAEDGRLYAAAQDITERKKAEDKLIESEEKFRTLSESSSIGVFYTDNEGKVLYTNPAWQKITGFSLRESLDFKWANALYDEDRPKVLADWAECLEKGKGYAGEFRFTHKEGDIKWVYTTTSPIRANDGTIIGHVGSNLDITERKETDAEREQLLNDISNKKEELQSIVYISSHDLKGPLVNIQGFSTMLNQSCKEIIDILKSHDISDEVMQKILPIMNEDIPESLEFISNSTNKMKVLLEGLLQASRIGTQELDIKTLDMNKILHSIKDTFEFQINDSQIELTVDDLPDCRGDEKQIDQIFSNILSNALKYLSPERPGVINITGKVQNGECLYCIEDNGIGIHKDHQARVFELFHRLNPDDSTDSHGLGLTIVKRALDRNKGRVWIESEPGKGSKFFVSLPKA